MKKRSYVLVSVLAVCGLVFWLSACGGGDGGGGGGSQSPDLTAASMDQTTAENALALAMSGGEVSDLSWSWIDYVYYRSAALESATTMSLADRALENAKEAILSGTVINLQGEGRYGSSSETGSCDSGTYKISGSWTGPNEPDDICDVSDVAMTMTFNDCQESGESADGTMIINIGGNMCSPTSLSVEFNSYSLYDSTSDLQIECDDFDMTLTNIQMTEDITDIVHVTSTMNGDINVGDISAEYYQYTEDITIDGSNQTITVSGSISGGCIDGWVTLTTLSPILVDDDSACPYGGSVQLSGTSDITVVFNSDGSLTVGEEYYASCEDLPDTCQ